MLLLELVNSLGASFVASELYSRGLHSGVRRRQVQVAGAALVLANGALSPHVAEAAQLSGPAAACLRALQALFRSASGAPSPHLLGTSSLITLWLATWVGVIAVGQGACDRVRSRPYALKRGMWACAGVLVVFGVLKLLKVDNAGGSGSGSSGGGGSGATAHAEAARALAATWAFLAFCYADVRRLRPAARPASPAAYCALVAEAAARVLPLLPCIAVGWSALLFVATSVAARARAPAAALRAVLHYGTLYGPYMTLHATIKRRSLAWLPTLSTDDVPARRL